MQQNDTGDFDKVNTLIEEGKTNEATALLESILLETINKPADIGLVNLAQAYFNARNEQLRAYADLLKENTKHLKELDEATKAISDTKEVIELRKTLE